MSKQITTASMFTDDQILKVAGPHTKLITYPQLKRYKTLDQAFGNKKNLILLYVHDESPNSITGHWCAIIRHPHSYEFWDSYGMMPDDIIMMKSDEDRANTHQEHNYLSSLLFNSKKNIEFNEFQFQNNDKDINTCGAHTGVRCRFSDISLNDYQHIFNTLKSHGVDTDKIVIELAKLFL